MMPRLVVAIGAYNEESYLKETIPAVLHQTMPDFRLILLDNGSTDRTWEIIRKFARRDKRIFAQRLRRNLWSGDITHHGMNLVHSAANATAWVVFHGADDLMDRDYLEALLDAKERHPSGNYFYSPHRFIDHPDMGVHRHPDYDPNDVCGPTVPFPNWSMLFRPLWDEIGGFDRTIRIGADWDFFVRASVQGLLRPVQLDVAKISLRIRPHGRLSQSAEVDWPRLHAHLKAHRKDQWATWADSEPSP